MDLRFQDRAADHVEGEVRFQDQATDAGVLDPSRRWTARPGRDYLDGNYRAPILGRSPNLEGRLNVHCRLGYSWKTAHQLVDHTNFQQCRSVCADVILTEMELLAYF